ncbi:uncharacterized protein Z520_09658 [Fonsecaea multimorphosa CBS 102226]|uniref:Uncharacterized protein n=1 Tax=Fonsecaea multimorphosa CBS 102226 TaxID=1442371 RepID=A0A0D2JMR8_9EURO|nr:uncharacterized protein Z520_09658 [Fonsecaea multimorphosa CBS 102226]KIX94612.1 hypothetical protein Z520_09658 [Fonsecaea multimorphosa CBS 102226]OAL20320.1 hypothetical protein AYO22_09032 [Fonsecaea multimorphosa]
MTAILAHIRSASALPVPDPILPKITIRHDFPPQAPSETGTTAGVQVARHTGTHGKRHHRSLSNDIKIALTSNPPMPMPSQYIQPQQFHRRGQERRLRPRFYPLDTGNSTNANSQQTTQVLSPSPVVSNSTGGLDLSAPSSQSSSLNDSSGMQTSTFIATATALSSAALASDVVTDTSPPLLPADSTPATTWIRTLPPTTALSTLAPPVPDPQPNLVTRTWFSGLTPTPTASQDASGPWGPDYSQGGNANCPFQSGINPTPDAGTTPDPSFPVIVTVFPISTSSSAVV